MPHSPVTPAEDRVRLLYRMRVRHLFHQMMARRGVDLKGDWWHGQEGMIAQAMDRCAGCQAAHICQDWLDHASSHEPSPDFCPNGATIEACQIMRTPSHEDKKTVEDARGIDGLLSDPLVRRTMAADHVNPEVLRLALTRNHRCFLAAIAAPNRPQRG